MEKREAEAVSKTKEQVYREQLQALGIYHEILEPEIKTLARVEREYTRAQKAWSATASPPGSAPSFLDPHYAIVQKLRAETLQHRESLMNTAKTLVKLTGAAGNTMPNKNDLIAQKLDAIAERVAAYDVLDDIISDQPGVMGGDPRRDPFAGIPGADEAVAISDMLDRQDHPDETEKKNRGYPVPAGNGPWYETDYCLASAVAEDMG